MDPSKDGKKSQEEMKVASEETSRETNITISLSHQVKKASMRSLNRNK